VPGAEAQFLSVVGTALSAITAFATAEIFPPELTDQFDEGRIFGNDLRVQTTKWGVVKGPDLFASISKSWAACRH